MTELETRSAASEVLIIGAGGHVTVGRRSAVSTGAAVKHGIAIADDVIVGAMSYVDEDIVTASVCYGVPCREIRKRSKGDPYL